MVVVTSKDLQRCDKSAYSYRVSTGASSRAVTAHRMRVEAQPTDKVMMVSSGGRVWIAAVGMVPEAGSWSQIGLKKDETIVHLDVIREQLPQAPEFLVLGTAKGRVKRTMMEAVLKNSVEGTWTQVIGLVAGDRVAFAGTCTENGSVLFFTDSRVLHIQASTVSDQQTPSARGVVGIKLGKDDAFLGGSVFSSPDRQAVLIVTEKGYMKQVPVKQFPVKGRGTQGVLSLNKTRATGNIVAVAAGRITTRTSIDVLAADGKRQRVPVAGIPVQNRANRGKKLITLTQAREIIVW
jgi:DNA gyrase/topoisomerase IV subunit A